jgi:hypothetical protein
MKHSKAFALLLSLGAFLPLAATAKTLEQTYLDSCRKGPEIPVPVAVVAPAVQGYDIGQTAQVRFVVDAVGLPSGIDIRAASDNGFVEAVADAVRQWRFTPALRNGAPVATKVILEIRVVKSGATNV